MEEALACEAIPDSTVRPAALCRVRVVLVRPSHPGNIGAAARAMLTMGFTQLHLVGPSAFPHPQAEAMASRATSVLSAAHVHGSLREALSGVTHAYAFSARPRDLSHPVMSVADVAAEAQAVLGGDGEVALVFGNETYGLDNAEVLLCNRLGTIPANPDYASLNLAQAVQVATYAMSTALARPLARRMLPARPAPREAVEGLVVALEEAAIASGFLDPTRPKRLVQRLRRLFARADIEAEEVALLRGIIAALRDKGARRA
jgi:tRNA/rRNA methyltransferase